MEIALQKYVNENGKIEIVNGLDLPKHGTVLDNIMKDTLMRNCQSRLSKLRTVLDMLEIYER